MLTEKKIKPVQRRPASSNKVFKRMKHACYNNPGCCRRRLSPCNVVQLHPTTCSNESNMLPTIMLSVVEEDQASPTSLMKKVFKWIQHVAYNDGCCCRCRSIPFNVVQTSSYKVIKWIQHVAYSVGCCSRR